MTCLFMTQAARKQDRKHNSQHAYVLNMQVQLQVNELRDEVSAATARADGLQKLFDYAQAEIARCASTLNAEQVSMHSLCSWSTCPSW